MSALWPLAVDSWGPQEREIAAHYIAHEPRTMGRKVREFEEAFADYTGAKYALMVNSGSSANLLLVAALQAIGRFGGQPVVLPALAWSTTYAPFIQLGIDIALQDIDPGTLNMIVSANDGSGAMCAVHIMGNPSPAKAECRYCRGTGFHPEGYVIDAGDALPPCPVYQGRAVLIEDCCESLGARYPDNTHVGTKGTGGTFSFFFSHHITTGEGGMVITSDRDLYHAMLSMRAHGWTRDIPGCDPGGWEFHWPGFNMRPMEWQGAVGLKQLARLGDFLIDRIHNAGVLRDALDPYRHWIRAQAITPGARHSHMAHALIVKEGTVPVPELTVRMNQAGIETRPVLTGFIGNHHMAKQWMPQAIEGQYPGAELISRQAFLIGNWGQRVTDLQIDTLCNVLATAEAENW